MFSLLHEYLITDLNTEKKKKSTVKKYKLYFGISVSPRTCIHMLYLNYVNFVVLQYYVVNTQSCLKICLFLSVGAAILSAN